jgi:hypothetical protein
MEYLQCKCTLAVQCFIPGKMRTHGKHSKLPLPTKLARLGHFPPASQAGRLVGPVFYALQIKGRCLVLIYVLPEKELLFPKQNYNVQSPSSYTHISVRDLYISRIGMPILLQGNMWTDPGNI